MYNNVSYTYFIVINLIIECRNHEFEFCIGASKNKHIAMYYN